MSCQVEQNCHGFSANCWKCKWSTEHNGNLEDFYGPINRTVKHPGRIAAKEARKQDRKNEARNKTVERSRSKIVKKAAKVEDSVRVTLNSGRVNRDGDLHTSDLALDVKMQSTTFSPTIKIDEWRKIQNDAIRGGKIHGVLVLVNSVGESFYVVSEALFKEAFLD
jgi:predicted glutamine amidotransferase